MAVTDNRTLNFNFPLPDVTNDLGDDVLRFIEALELIDTRLQEIVNQTQSPDAATLSGNDLAFILALANAIGVLPVAKGGTGATTPEGARAAIGFDGAWDAKLAAALNTAPATLDTLLEIVAEVENNDTAIAAINAVLATKAAQTAMDAVEGELDVILPDGASGTFTYPRMTTAERDALDMTGKGAGYEIYNTTTDQVEAWDGTSAWGAAASGGGVPVEAGGYSLVYGLKTSPDGWEDSSALTVEVISTAHASPQAMDANYGQFGKLNDGRLYHIRGNGIPGDGNSPGYIFDPSDGSYTEIADKSDGYRQFYGNAITLPDDRILVAGGRNSASDNTVLNICRIYDPATNTWSNTGSMPDIRWGAGLILNAAGTEVYCFGGFSVSNQSTYPSTILKYNISAGTWSTAATVPNTTSIGGFGYHAGQPVIRLASGKFVFYMRNYVSNSWVYHCYLFDPTDNSFTSVSILGNGTTDEPNGATYGDFFGTGAQWYFVRSNAFWSYDEGLDQWTKTVFTSHPFFGQQGTSRSLFAPFGAWYANSGGWGMYLFKLVVRRTA